MERVTGSASRPASRSEPVVSGIARVVIQASAPKLPENPSPEQLDAWIELADLVADPSFIQSLRESAKEVWGKFDMNAMRRASDDVHEHRIERH